VATYDLRICGTGRSLLARCGLVASELRWFEPLVTDDRDNLRGARSYYIQLAQINTIKRPPKDNTRSGG
jgi:hypothetical protein